MSSKFENDRKTTRFKDKGGSRVLTTSLNWGPDVYSPDNAIFFEVGRSDESASTFLSISRDDAVELIGKLKELVATVDAAKPKAPSVPEQIEALPVGTIFTVGRDSTYFYARTKNATTPLADPTQSYPFRDYLGYQNIEIRFDPSK